MTDPVGKLGIPGPYRELRCGKCGKLIAKHFAGGVLVARCPRSSCKAVIAIGDKGSVNVALSKEG